MHLFAVAIGSDLLDMGIPLADKVVRTLVVYAALVALLRFAGKREVAQLNSFDLVVLLLLSNVVQNAVIGPDNSLLGGLIGAVVLVAGNALVVRWVMRSSRAVKVLEGEPTVLIRHGRIDKAALRDLGLRPAEVAAAVRRQGASTVSEVAEASLTPGGTVIVRLNKDDENASKGDVERVERKLDAVLERLGRSPG